MKKAIVILVVFFFLGTVVASAQPAGKKWELGGSLSFASFKFSGADSSTTVINLPVRIGYYIWKGLEIEPEIMYTKFEGSDAGYLLSANVAYNFKLPSTANIIPFVLGGIGFGNGFSIAGITEGDTAFNAFAYQFGFGAKFLVGPSAAFRVEYRFMHDQLSETGFPDENVSSHQILAGISLFF